MCNEQELTVVAAASWGWRFTFRRGLLVDLQEQMRGLHSLLCTIDFTNETDKPI
jgi:hypothetical protein